MVLQKAPLVKKQSVTALTFNLTMACSMFIFVQELHDLSVDIWVLHGITSPDIAAAAAHDRLRFWRNFYAWRSSSMFDLYDLAMRLPPGLSLAAGGGVILVVGYLLLYCSLTRVAPIARHYADLALLVLLAVKASLTCIDIAPLKGLARDCRLPLHSPSVNQLSASRHHQLHSAECAHLAVDLCLVNMLMVTIQACMLLTVVIRFTSSEKESINQKRKSRRKSDRELWKKVEQSKSE